MHKYGVAFAIEMSNKRNCNNMNKFPQVTTCSSREYAIEAAKRMSLLYGEAIPFENPEEKKEVDWNYVMAHEIV